MTPTHGPISAADVSLLQPDADGWFDIASAPKDGSRFESQDRANYGERIFQRTYWYVHPAVQGWVTEEIDCCDYEFSATHWRPHLASPASSSSVVQGDASGSGWDEAFCEAYYQAHLDHAWSALREGKPYQVNADGAISLIQQAAADRRAVKAWQMSSRPQSSGETREDVPLGAQHSTATDFPPDEVLACVGSDDAPVSRPGDGVERDLARDVEVLLNDLRKARDKRKDGDPVRDEFDRHIRTVEALTPPAEPVSCPAGEGEGEREAVARITGDDLHEILASFEDRADVGEIATKINERLALLSPAAPDAGGGWIDRAPNFGFPTNEPSPRQMVEHYYRSHGMENWQRLADQYCTALQPGGER